MRAIFETHIFDREVGISACVNVVKTHLSCDIVDFRERTEFNTS